MKKDGLSVIVFVILALALVSNQACDKKGVSGPEQPAQPSSMIFPLAVGNWWVIHTTNYDTTGAVYSTRQDTIRILRDTTINNERWFIGYGILTNRVDGLYDYQPGSVSPASLELKYPVSVPNDWVYRGIPMKILAVNDTLTVPAGTFVCHYYRSGYDGITYNDEFYSPEIGLVKRECYNPLAGGGVYKYLEYELVAYQVQ